MPGPSLTAAQVTAAFGAKSAAHLGSGTYGETWHVDGIEIDGNTTVSAVKFLRPEHFRAHLVAREVEGLMAFDDEHVVKLHAVTEREIDGESHTALLCEYIAGGDVNSNLALGRPSQKKTIGFAAELLTAVALLHASERMHRDLKPENIILRDGNWLRPVLIDFGLSKSVTDVTRTLYPQRVGSLRYMAPQQLAGQKPRNASDLWACGVILFEVIAGRHPFIDDFAGLTEDDVADQVAGPPASLPDGTHPILVEIVERLLAEEPYARGTAERASTDLRKALK